MSNTLLRCLRLEYGKQCRDVASSAFAQCLARDADEEGFPWDSNELLVFQGMFRAGVACC